MNGLSNDIAQLVSARIKIARELYPYIYDEQKKAEQFVPHVFLNEELVKRAEGESWIARLLGIKNPFGKFTEQDIQYAKNLMALGKYLNINNIKRFFKNPLFSGLIALVVAALLGRKNWLGGLLGGAGAGLATYGLTNPDKAQQWFSMFRNWSGLTRNQNRINPEDIVPSPDQIKSTPKLNITPSPGQSTGGSIGVNLPSAAEEAMRAAAKSFTETAKRLGEVPDERAMEQSWAGLSKVLSDRFGVMQTELEPLKQRYFEMLK